MKIYEIIEGRKCYWTENKNMKMSFWSHYSIDGIEKRNFFILKALILYIIMKLNGNKVMLEK